MRFIHAAAMAAAPCVALCVSAAVLPVEAQSPAAMATGMPPELKAIRESDLKRDLYFFASDSMRGREAGTLDELRAGSWMAQQARKAGLLPAGNDGTFFQWWSMHRLRQSDNSHLSIGGTPLVLGRDIVVLAPVDASIDAPLMFVEPGATSDSGAIRGKAVVTEIPAPASGEVPRRYAMVAMRQASQRFLALGAVAVLVVSDAASEQSGFASAVDQLPRGRYGIDSAGTVAYWPDAVGGAVRPPPAPPVLWVRRAMLGKLRAPDQRFTAQLVTEDFLYPSVNIIGVVHGTDPKLRTQYVEYSGHLDHDGVRSPIAGDSIWNGADDNGSVDVGILAVARAFVKHPGRRSVIFVWHGAEERGLLGSRYFVNHPTVPRDSIVADLNGDMIGRNNPDSATILGVQPPHRNSPMLVRMALDANQRITKFGIDSVWDRPSHPEGWYFRSDHIPYARVGIPAISFSTNLHADYHRPSDERQRIDYAKLTRMA
ncbi:MAG: M28 family peptidase, partial [Gemmatimonadaceae bacterium]